MVDLIAKYMWYILLVGIGGCFRYHLLLKYNDITRKRIFTCEILTVMAISCLFSNDEIMLDKSSFLVTVGLFAGYSFYILIKKIPKGYTESGLTIVNGYLVTTLSFMEFPWNILLIISIVILSIVMLKFFRNEKKSDFWEILFLCVELLLVSVYMFYYRIDDSIEIILVVLFVETALYTFNCFFKYFLMWRKY